MKMRLSTIIVIGVAVRLAIAPFLAHPSDVFEWYLVSQNFLNGTDPATNYMVPYGYSYFLFVFPSALAYGFLSHFIPTFSFSITSISPQLNPGFGVTEVPGLLFNFLVKLPLILSDTLIALLIFRLVKSSLGDYNAAVTAATIWFLNPFVIWISSAWGMFDTLPALFTVLSFYLILQEKPLFSGISLVASIAMKYYALVLVFPLMMIVWKKSGKRAVYEFILSVCVTGLVLFSPLIARSLKVFASLTLIGSSPVATLYPGLSLWTAVTTVFPGFNQALASDIILVPVMIVAYVWIWKKRLANDFVTNVVTLAIPILFLLLLYRWVGENFFIWILPFLSIVFVNDRKGKLLYWLISLVALLSSVTDSLLPYYLLPLAPWIGDLLMKGLSAVGPYRTTAKVSKGGAPNVGRIVLSALGLAASALLVLIFLRLISISRESSTAAERHPYPEATVHERP